jgi:hypothetical protein
MLKIRGRKISAQCWINNYKHQPEQAEGEGGGFIRGQTGTTHKQEEEWSVVQIL